MHLTIKPQDKAEKRAAIMCIEKSIRTCIILNATPAEAETFATLAHALGITKVLYLADPDVQRECPGWKQERDRVLLSKEVR